MTLAKIVCFSIFALAAPTLAYHFWEQYVDAFDYFGSAALRTCPSSLNLACPRLSLADLFGSAMATHYYRASLSQRMYWLDTLFGCTVLQFGGTTCTGLILGQTPSWLSSATAFPSLFICWWLTFFCPFDAWFQLLHFEYAKFPILLGVWMSSAHAVTSWGMDKALGADHLRAQGSVLVALATGTMSACGGGILSEMLGLKLPVWKFKKPTCLECSSLPIEKAFLCALLYYALVDPHRLLWPPGVAFTALEGRALIGITMFELNFALYLFPKIRVTEVIGVIAGRLLNISPYFDPNRHQNQATNIEFQAPRRDKVE
mmetsp:Transcript_88278/g.176540  ORF Transcript_88278/g.176540 Transcript_88278/m.176540 type:complete len:316 (-) Transcript_88278:90-1037(-)